MSGCGVLVEVGVSLMLCGYEGKGRCMHVENCSPILFMCRDLVSGTQSEQSHRLSASALLYAVCSNDMFPNTSPVSTVGILSSCVWVNVNRPSLPLLCPVSSHCWLFPCLCLLCYMSQMRWTLEFSGGPVGPGVFGEHSQNLHVIQ